MDASLLVLAVLSCLAFKSSGQEFELYPPTDDQWFLVDSDVSLNCQWQHDYPSRVQVMWRHDGSTNIRKITEGDTENTYPYEDSGIEEKRQRETHDFDESADAALKQQYSELTILNITLTDPRSYLCTVEIGTGVRQDSAEFNINLYATPTVKTVDNVTSVDIRPPIDTEESANETATVVNGTENQPVDDEADFGNSTDYQSDEATEDEETEKLIFDCEIEGGYPEPEVFFRVGEGEGIRVMPKWDVGSNTELYTGWARLKLDPNPKYDGKSVTCYAVLDTQPKETIIESNQPSSPIEILHEVTVVTTSIVPEVAIAGKEVKIRCASNGNPMPTFEVMTDVADQPSFERSEDGTTFTIPSVIKQDAGTYYCLATLPSRTGDDTEVETKEGDSRQLQVQYIEEPKVEDSPKIVLSKGGSRTLVCEGSGNPPPSFTWKKGGKVSSSSKTLEINDAVYEDEGTYTCEISNEAGTKSQDIEVSVQGACKSSFKPAVVAASSKEAGSFYVKLECEADGNPECTVAIKAQHGFEVEGTTKENGRVLVFEGLPKLSSPVQFFCISKNSVGKSNVSTTIDDKTDACCAEPVTAGLSVGAIIGIILLILVVVIGIPVACYFVKKRNAADKKKTPEDPEEAEPEKEGLNKDASSEDSDTGSLPPPPADMEPDHRLNHGAHEMTTFSSNQ